MKSIITIIILGALNFVAFGSSIDDSNSADKRETLYQCGEGTEQNFDGWSINGLAHGALTYFENSHIEFFNHQAGECAIEISKKIDEMIGFSDLSFAFDFSELENCKLNYATAYLSVDGKDWDAINKPANHGEIHSFNDQMNYLFVKVVANVSFFKEGRFRMNRAKIMGAYSALKTRPNVSVADIHKERNINQLADKFFVFSFEKNIHIETQNEEDFEMVLTNLAGQVIVQEKSNGSVRIETTVPDGIYFISIIQNSKLKMTKKVVL
jgi:hypothetical protein